MLCAVAAFTGTALAYDANRFRALREMASGKNIVDTMLTKSRYNAKRFAELLADNNTYAPQQLHLALTNDATQMTIVWVTDAVVHGSVAWWPAGGTEANATFAGAVETTYTAGMFGWNGKLVFAVPVASCLTRES